MKVQEAVIVAVKEVEEKDLLVCNPKKKEKDNNN